MGSLSLPEHGRVYLDANCFIYSVEGVEPYYSILKPLWRVVSSKQLTIVTSEITLLEVLVKPLKMGDFDMANDFRTLLHQSPEVQMIPITQIILEGAAKLRATTNIKTPDAIYATTASSHQCVLFMTNDKVFRQATGIPVQILDDVNLQKNLDNEY